MKREGALEAAKSVSEFAHITSERETQGILVLWRSTESPVGLLLGASLPSLLRTINLLPSFIVQVYCGAGKQAYTWRVKLNTRLQD